MGETLSKDIQPEELSTFKKLPTNTLLDNIQIPERPENRRPTDKKFLIIFLVTAVILMPFLIYTMVNGDLGRLSGYDQCGNVCGKKNSRYDEWSCTGQDFTDEPYLQYETSQAEILGDENLLTSRKCVSSCENDYTLAYGHCWKKRESNNFRFGGTSFGDQYRRFKRAISYSSRRSNDADEDVAGFLKNYAWRIVLSCFLSIGVTLGMLFLFRTATAAVVWSILGGVLLFGTILVGGCWYLYFNVDSNSNQAQDAKKGFLFMCIIFTVILLVLFCVMVFMYKKIQLVIQLLKETTKAIFAMPTIIFTPVLTFLFSLIILGLLGFNTVFMFTSGTLTEIVPGYLYYKENAVMVFTLIFNFWMAFWALQFVTGIQYMVIAGAVATWYWSKNKHNLDKPISKSASIVFRFHLGSIAFGSMIITLIAIVRAIISSIVKNKNLKVCVDYCMGSIESFLKFLSKNSYILTAMHGKPFYKSGKRAAKIIFQNAVNIASVNYIGDFVLGMAQLLIILISMLINMLVMMGVSGPVVSISYVIVFLVSLAVAITFFSPFETTIDTIFLCFCEDSLLNDGMARPYAMSRDLMEFVENSKKVYGEKK